VTISGIPAPERTVVSAVVAGGGGSFTTTTAGSYGSTCPVCPRLLVQGQIEEGSNITFLVNGIAAECLSPGTGASWQATYPFKQDSSTRLDLRISGPLHFIQASAGTGGSITPSGNVPVVEGTDRVFTILPDTCYEILDVLVNGTSVGPVSSYTFPNVTANQTIHATFSKLSYLVSATAHQGGTINPSGTQEVDCGDDFTFTISPDTGHLIDNVFLDSIPLGPVTGYTITSVSKDYVINAYFTPLTYFIDASAGLNGNITPEGTVPVSYGDDQTFVMLPDPGYRVGSVVVNGETQPGAPTSYTFTDITGNQTISVSFVEGPPEYFTTTLGDGWNLFSTPIELAPGHKRLAQIFPPGELEHIEVFLGWNGYDWFIPGNTFELVSSDAIYVKVDGSATAYIYPDPSPQPCPLPDRNVNAGWNLLGPAPIYQESTFPVVPVDDALITLYYDTTGLLPGYQIAISPGPNQPTWVYYRDNPPVDLLPYKGYWIYMQNPGKLARFFSPVY
jgi:hypothetical protein